MDLKGLLSNSYSGFTLELVVSMIEDDTPWNVLTIFEKVSFSGDFNGKFFSKNEDIIWHLEAIGRALLKHTTELEYGNNHKRPFHYERKEIENSQAKLFYSLLYFVLDSLSNGFTKVIEAGAGVDEGGLNHVAVYEVLADMGKQVEFDLFDIEHVDKKETFKGHVINHKRQVVFNTSKFEAPVFCDIYNLLTWRNLQKELEAPRKMMKAVAWTKDCECVFLQPYHKEVRIMKSNQFAYFLLSFLQDDDEFDTCYDCCLWRALSIQFGVSKTTLLSQLLRLGLKCCRSVAGAGLARLVSMPQKEKIERLAANLRVDYRSVSTNTLKGVSSVEQHMCDVFLERNDLKLKYEGNSICSSRNLSPSGVEVYFDCDFQLYDETCVGYFDLRYCMNFKKILMSKGYVILDEMKGSNIGIVWIAAEGNELPEITEINLNKLRGLDDRIITLPCVEHKVCYGPYCNKSLVLVERDESYACVRIGSKTEEMKFKVIRQDPVVLLKRCYFFDQNVLTDEERQLVLLGMKRDGVSFVGHDIKILTDEIVCDNKHYKKGNNMIMLINELLRLKFG